MDPLRKAQSFFGDKAEAYRASPSHGQKEDLRRMMSLLGSGGRALDVATGGGHAALALAGSFRPVVALDVTRSMLANVAGPRLMGDAARLPFRAGSFDAVACRIAAHHFADLRGFVAEAARVLARGGRLYVYDLTAPERRDVGAWIDEVERLRDPSHVSSWSLEAWRRALAQSGLTVQHLQRIESRFDLDPWIHRAQMPAERERELRRRLAHPPEGLEGYGATRDGRMTVLRVELLALKEK